MKGKPATKADIPTVFMKYCPARWDEMMSISELARISGLLQLTVYTKMKFAADVIHHKLICLHTQIRIVSTFRPRMF